MKAVVSEEVELAAPAQALWEVYSTIRLSEVCLASMPEVISKVEWVEGDGGEGSILKVHYAPGWPGRGYYKEKFTKIDEDERIKEATLIEGGHLDLGFLSFVMRFHILEKPIAAATAATTDDGGGDNATLPCRSVIVITLEYETDDEFPLNKSSLTAVMDSLVRLAKVVEMHLMKDVNPATKGTI